MANRLTWGLLALAVLGIWVQVYINSRAYDELLVIRAQLVAIQGQQR
jgi:hypothetical protein